MVLLRTTLRRALVTGALLLPLAALFVPSDAGASVSVAVQYEQLVKDADLVVIVTPSAAKSVWEDGRIYTYTDLRVEQPVAGEAAAGQTRTVRTMGGIVGEIGQLVDGEPVFTKDKSSLVFLRKFNANGVFEVSARGQGQYPVVVDAQTKVRKLIRSTSAGLLLPPKPQAASTGEVKPQSASVEPTASEVAKPRLAHDFLHERVLEDATRELATTWKRLHPAPATK